jgi:hypothetical protein
MPRLTLALLLVVGACARSAPRPPDPAPPDATVVTPPAPAPPTPEERLRALAVSDDDFFRGVLYTWTTPASIAALRVSGQLLVATAKSGGFTSPFNRALRRTAARAGKGRAIARLLTTSPALVHRRYAWPAPYATVLGVGPRTYANALIRIELHPDAWIGRYEPSSPDPFTFVDARGAPVAAADVIAAPERIAAIFHVRTEPGIPVRFREYVIVNAGMVASWSVATPAIRAELDAEISLLEALRDRFATLPRAEVTAPAAPAWSAPPATLDPLLLWHAALAFDNPRYRPTAAQIDAILAALRAYDPTGEPLTIPATPAHTRAAAPPTRRALRRTRRPAS